MIPKSLARNKLKESQEPDKPHEWQTRVQTQVLFISKCSLLKMILNCMYR